MSFKRATANGQEESQSRVEDLLCQCRTLLKELDDFRSFIAANKQGRSGEVVEIRHFCSAVQAELRSLEKVRHSMYDLMFDFRLIRRFSICFISQK